MLTVTAEQEEALTRAVIDSPDDPLVKLVFADWLDDHDRTAEARAYRFCASNDRHPVSHYTDESSWTWYASQKASGVPYPSRAVLPEWLHPGMGEGNLLRRDGWNRESFFLVMLMLVRALSRCPEPPKESLCQD